MREGLIFDLMCRNCTTTTTVTCQYCFGRRIAAIPSCELGLVFTKDEDRMHAMRYLYPTIPKNVGQWG